MANVLLRVSGVHSYCRAHNIGNCLLYTIEYYVLSAPNVLPDLCTVKQYERQRKQIIQHGVPAQILVTQRVKIARHKLNGRNFPPTNKQKINLGLTLAQCKCSWN